MTRRARSAGRSAAQGRSVQRGAGSAPDGRGDAPLRRAPDEGVVGPPVRANGGHSGPVPSGPGWADLPPRRTDEGAAGRSDRENGLHPAEPHRVAAAGSPPRQGADQPACTTAQLRRFIKSRAYVPMHELRRRFGINGTEDEVTPVTLDTGTVFVGLPLQEGQLLGELVRGGEVGFELSLDPRSPVVVGVYPMRPVPRS